MRVNINEPINSSIVIPMSKLYGAKFILICDGKLLSVKNSPSELNLKPSTKILAIGTLTLEI